MSDLKKEHLHGMVDAIETLLRDAQAERDKLRAFAQDIMRAWPECDVDGGELQEAALRHGLLAPATPTQEERDEWGLDEHDEWYRRTALIAAQENTNG